MTQKAAILVLDRSGSMKSILDNTIAGLNSYLEGVKAEPDLLFTMITFDTIGTDVVRRRVPIAEIPAFTNDDLVPRGGTPLIDALAIAIESAKETYKDDDRVVIVTMTDGQENASTGHTRDQLHAMIKERSAVGWQFVFLGASIDAYRAARQYGISGQSTMSYDSASLSGNINTYSSVARASNEYYSTGEALNFTDKDKADAGDTFAPSAGPTVEPPAKSLVDRVKL